MLSSFIDSCFSICIVYFNIYFLNNIFVDKKGGLRTAHPSLLDDTLSDNILTIHSQQAHSTSHQVFCLLWQNTTDPVVLTGEIVSRLQFALRNVSSTSDFLKCFITSFHDKYMKWGLLDIAQYHEDRDKIFQEGAKICSVMEEGDDQSNKDLKKFFTQFIAQSWFKLTSEIPFSDKILLYREIFWNSPWNEWFICKNCTQTYSIDFTSWDCSVCNASLDLFHSTEVLRQDIENYKSYPNFYEKFLEDDSIYVWMIIWWETGLTQLNNDKFFLSSGNFNEVKTSLCSYDTSLDVDNFFYLAEVWVLSEYRKQWWSDILYQQLKLHVQSIGQKFIVLRTSQKFADIFQWFLSKGAIKVHDFGDKTGRVLMLIPL